MQAVYQTHAQVPYISKPSPSRSRQFIRHVPRCHHTDVVDVDVDDEQLFSGCFLMSRFSSRYFIMILFEEKGEFSSSHLDRSSTSVPQVAFTCWVLEHAEHPLSNKYACQNPTQTAAAPEGH